MKQTLHNVSRLCGVIGLVLILSAPLSWVLTNGLGPLVWTKLILGAALGAIDIVVHRGLPAFGVSQRQVAVHGLAAATTVVVTVAVVLANVVAAKYPRELDMTAGAVHTLAPQTLQLLGRLQTPVEVLAFYADVEPVRAGVAERLERYRRNSTQLRYQIIDPNLRPDLVGA